MRIEHLPRAGWRAVSCAAASLLVLAVLLAACASAPSNAVGRFHRPITTTSTQAQRCVDEGLLLCYGFNHDEAVRRFEAALQADPDCAMAWCGIAWALGPNINLPLGDAEVGRRAHAAAQRAFALASRGTQVERDLIAAVAQRYADPPPADRSGLDRAFADAMRAVHRAHPDDACVGAIFADAMLNLAPWDQWTADGTPKPGTEEIVATLEHVLERAPEHPFAIHLYIHATEASPTPERAAPFAAKLAALAPGCGHLVHMPAHTWQRMGRYRDALEANVAATAADHAYFAKAGPQGIYHSYLAHNQHFAVYAAMFAGDRASAVRAARELVADLPPHLLRTHPKFFDGFLAVPLHALLRFGEWEQVLAEPAPPAGFPIAQAMWHYARGVAHANRREIDAARREQAAFTDAVAKVPAAATVGLTPAAQVLAVARDMLDGELSFHAGDRERAFAKLRQAIATEDALRYDEPRGWMMPIRHALGALLLADGRHEEAERVYRDDLAWHRDNGWALHGLAECLRRRNAPEAAAVEAAFRRAWAHADVEIAASCFCSPACCAPEKPRVTAAPAAAAGPGAATRS
jgi:tetratricopeptide (TPR) repeat protein